jgi:hypothetical protein
LCPTTLPWGRSRAEFARGQGIERAFVLYAADDPTSTGQASNFRSAAGALGIDVVGYETWNPDASSYVGLLREGPRPGRTEFCSLG